MIQGAATGTARNLTETAGGNARLRDVALASLGGAFVFGAAALGVFASKDGDSMLAACLGVPAIALLILFGVVWDSQHPRTETLAERIRPGMRHLAWIALIVAYVGWTVSRH